jgi:hypothetical protein
MQPGKARHAQQKKVRPITNQGLAPERLIVKHGLFMA